MNKSNHSGRIRAEVRLRQGREHPTPELVRQCEIDRDTDWLSTRTCTSMDGAKTLATLAYDSAYPVGDVVYLVEQGLSVERIALIIISGINGRAALHSIRTGDTNIPAELNYNER